MGRSGLPALAVCASECQRANVLGSFPDDRTQTGARILNTGRFWSRELAVARIMVKSAAYQISVMHPRSPSARGA